MTDIQSTIRDCNDPDHLPFDYLICQTGRGYPKEPIGSVYYIACSVTGRMKVGFTRGSVYARLATLQTGASSKLKLMAYHPGTRLDEAEIHRYFDDRRLHGEWFEMSEELFMHLMAVFWITAAKVIDGAIDPEPWLVLGLTIMEDCMGPLPPAYAALAA